MNSSQTKPYIVFTWKLANALYKRGFRPIGKKLNFKDPTRAVILFEDTPELRKAIEEITEK